MTRADERRARSRSPRPRNRDTSRPTASTSAPRSARASSAVRPPFRAGEALFREGDAATEAFLLQEGRVRLLKRVRDGRAQPLGRARRGPLRRRRAPRRRPQARRRWRSPTASASRSIARPSARSSSAIPRRDARPHAARSAPARRRGPDRDPDAPRHPVEGGQRPPQARRAARHSSDAAGKSTPPAPRSRLARRALEPRGARRRDREAGGPAPPRAAVRKIVGERIEIPDLEALRRSTVSSARRKSSRASATRDRTASRERRIRAHIRFGRRAGCERVRRPATRVDQMSMPKSSGAPCAVDLATACKVIPQT